MSKVLIWVPVAFLILFCGQLLAQGGASPFAETQVAESSQGSADDVVFHEAAAGSFHAEFLQAVSKARQAGKITRRQALRIRIKLLSPSFRDHCEGLCVTQMVFSEAEDLPVNVDGSIDQTAIDWDSLADFLERMIPIILQLIEIFGG